MPKKPTATAYPPELRTVQMRLSVDTIGSARSLAVLLRVRSRTDSIRMAIDIALFVVDAIKNGGKELLLRNKRGELERVVIPGLSP